MNNLIYLPKLVRFLKPSHGIYATLDIFQLISYAGIGKIWNMNRIHFIWIWNVGLVNFSFIGCSFNNQRNTAKTVILITLKICPKHLIFFFNVSYCRFTKEKVDHLKKEAWHWGRSLQQHTHFLVRDLWWLVPTTRAPGNLSVISMEF